MSATETGPASRPASGQVRHAPPVRPVVVTGLVATVAAMVVTTLAAASAGAVGVDFELPDGGESIPLSGFALMTGFFSLVGTVLAAGLRRWSARPVQRFVWTAVPLTVVSLVPPFLSGGNAGTVAALVGLHLVAAAVMIPALAGAIGRAGPPPRARP